MPPRYPPAHQVGCPRAETPQERRRAIPTPDDHTVAETLADAIAGVAPALLPDAVRGVAGDLVLDVIGLCLAARRTHYVAAAIAGSDGEGDATLIGHRQTLSAAGAALVNGIAAHGEDFDDTFEGGPVHAGAVIVPAVLAAAARHNPQGAAVLRGIVAGAETICRLSLVAPKRVHQAGFHPTSVFGALASAAAVAATLDLEPATIVNALGIAGSMASGIIEYLSDGSSTKRLHAGWAAQSGLRAALLARAGFTGPRRVLEGAHGVFNAFARNRAGDFGKLLDGFGERWVMETLAFKPYACGTMIHPYIDCARRLAASGIAAEDIVEIVCEVAEGTVHRLWEPLAAKQSPPNGYAAKFSAPFCVATAFVTGDIGLASFGDATLADPRIRTLAGRTRFVVDPANPYPAEYTGHARVTLRDGRVIEERQPHLRGGVHEPLSRAEIEGKFRANAAHGGWPPARADAARDLARTLFDAPLDLSVLRG
ncbi:MAG TPA: MmgE/PrpD family protein [Stellaceae bacterium]|nr:MmgE/PrpD family protein [Stellaceae bacterium]